MSLSIKDLKETAYNSGFDAVDVVTMPEALHDERWPSRTQAYLDWCHGGCAGDMHYMTRDVSRRTDWFKSVPWAKTMIVVAVSYYNKGDGRRVRNDRWGKVSRYAWGKDYHSVIRERLLRLATLIQEMSERDIKWKINLDTGPYMERALAELAGIGFFGKNTNIIVPGVGSYVFLGLLITDLELEKVPHAVIANVAGSRKLQLANLKIRRLKPATTSFEIATPPLAPRNDDSECGSCRLCLDACLTGALTAPYRLDARRCISYLTIENRGPIPNDVAGKLGQSVFGCDRCQEVCPHNKLAKETSWKEFQPESGVGPELDLKEIMSIKDEEEFKDRFAGTPLLRAGLSGLKRNAQTVIKNL